MSSRSRSPRSRQPGWCRSSQATPAATRAAVTSWAWLWDGVMGIASLRAQRVAGPAAPDGRGRRAGWGSRRAGLAAAALGLRFGGLLVAGGELAGAVGQL